MRTWLIGALGVSLALMGQAGGPGLTQAQKDSLLSRKKWYVTVDFTTSGNGESGAGTWRMSRSATVTLQLNLPIPGQWPQSLPADPDFIQQTGRFITWMASPTDVAYAAIERGESDPGKLENHYYRLRRAATDSRQSTDRSDTWIGAGQGFALGPMMLSLDLKEGTYDVVFQVGPTDLGPSIRHEWSSPNTSGTAEAAPSHHMAWLAPGLIPQLAMRKLSQDMKPDGSIVFTLAGPVEQNGPLGVIAPAATATFRLSPTPPSTATLTIEPEDQAEYQAWRPEPGPDEEEPGSNLVFNWAVTEPGVPPAERAKIVKLTFRLGQVSRHPGVCMNWPPPSSSGGAAAKPKPDLRFEPPEFSTQIDYTVQDEGLVAILADRAVIRHSGEIVVECYDGAAIGELIAEAELEDGRVLQAEVKGQAGSKKILIPDREEGVSEIARAWRTRRAAGLEDKEDNEDKPAGDSSPGNGDGLSVWEEYRGFYQGGAWRDNCLPFQKDLFVINKVGALAKDGIELFRDVTALVVHDELLDEEADTLLVVNHQARADRKIVDQHCLRMKEVSGGVGYARRMPGQKFPGPPKNTLSVRVAMTASVNVVYQITPTIRVTRNSNSKHIAHELGHGIGIYHHGDRDHFGGIGWFRATGITIPFLSTPVDRVIEGSLAGRQIDVLLEAGLAPLSNDQIFGVGENGITIWIGERSGQHSGDADCIMRYQVAKAYRREGSPSTRVIHATREAPGDTLCTSPAGTIFNDPTHAPQSRYGPADTKRGNCAHQFVISDKYDKQYR